MGHLAWRAATLLGVLYSAVLVLLSVANLLAPQRHGLLALGQIMAPLLFLLLVPFVPLAFVRAARRRTCSAQVAAHRPGCLRGRCGRSFRARLDTQRVAARARRRAGAGRDRMEHGRGDSGSWTTWLPRSRMRGPGSSASRSWGGTVRRRLPRIRLLLKRFPYRVLAPEDTSLGIGLLSSYPFIRRANDPLRSPLDRGTSRSGHRSWRSTWW